MLNYYLLEFLCLLIQLTTLLITECVINFIFNLGENCIIMILLGEGASMEENILLQPNQSFRIQDKMMALLLLSK